MTFWLFASILIALIVVFTLLPMMLGGGEEDSLGFARAFYREREAEFAAQLAGGEIDQAAFDAALAEQGRRLLALAKAEQAQPGPEKTTRRRKVAALIMLFFVPIFSIGLYARLGRPGMADVPLAGRQVAPKDFDVATAIEKMELHLARNPDDLHGLEIIAPVYIRGGRFEDAAKAWRRVIAIAGESAPRLGDLGEALVAAGNGVISAEARQMFEAALKLDPAQRRASFYLALALEQDGRKEEAIGALERLRDDLPESIARERVGGEIARIKGVDVPAGGEGIAAMPEPERRQAISAMVDGLEARLFAQGGSLGEWQRLIRSQLVLGQKERVMASLEKAREAFKDRPEGKALTEALEALVREER